MAAAPPRGPPFPLNPLPPPYPPPLLLPNPSMRKILQHLLARVTHIDRRMGQLFQVYNAVNNKINAILDAQDVEYNPLDDYVSNLSDDSLPSGNDGEE